MKDLMKKYYNLSEGGVNSLSQPITERFRESTIFAKLTNAKQQNQLANNIKSKGNTDKKHERQDPKGRSVTEADIFKDIATARSLQFPQGSPLGEKNPFEKLRGNSPINLNRRRMKSNEGLFFTQESQGNPLSSRRSPEGARSIGDPTRVEMFLNLNHNLDAVKMFDMKKAEYKQQNQKKMSASYQKKSSKAIQHFEFDQYAEEPLGSSRNQSYLFLLYLVENLQIDLIVSQTIIIGATRT